MGANHSEGAGSSIELARRRDGSQIDGVLSESGPWATGTPPAALHLGELGAFSLRSSHLSRS